MKPKDLLLPAASGSLAVCFTHPLELTKSRLQLDNERAAAGSPRKYLNWIDCFTKNLQTDGVRGLQRGLSLGVTREFFFNGLRIGMYEPLLDAVHSTFGTKGEPPSPTERVATSITCGALGTATCNPLEVLKVRLQVQGGATGHQHAYTGVGAALRSLVRDEGLRGCTRGMGVSVLRGILGPGSQLFAYNELKRSLTEQRGFSPTAFSTHVACALGSAAVSVACMNPADVIRTRLYNAPEGWYANGLDAARQLVRTEGVSAFYKGAMTSYLRLGPHMVLVFSILEQLKQWF